MTFFNGDSTITGGLINNVVIGGVTPGVITGTTVTANSSFVSDILDSQTATSLQIAPTTATGLTLGKSSSDTVVSGGLRVTAGAAAANIGIDTTAAGALSLGGQTATSLNLGSASVNTTVLGQTVIKQGTGVNAGIDTAAAGVLHIGEATATSLELGATDADTSILGKTLVKQGTGVNTGIDTAAAGVLAIGEATATSLTLGAADADTSILGKTIVKQGAAGANTGIDTAAAGILALGGQTATSLELGATDADTSILGDLGVNGNAVITGNLTVNGDQTVVNTEHLNIADDCILLNSEYSAEAAKAGCVVVNIDPDTTAQASVAGSAFLSDATAGTGTGATVEVDATTGFTVGDYVIITGANLASNNGIFEVTALLATPTRIEVAGTGTGAIAPSDTDYFVQIDFTDDTTVAGLITKTKLSVLKTTTAGTWQVGNSATAPITFSDLSVGISITGTDNRIVRMDGTGSIQDSGLTIDDSDNVTFAGATYLSNEVISATADDGTSIDAINLGKDASIVEVASGTANAYLTLANGTVVGQRKILLIKSIGSAVSAEVKVTSYLAADGTSGTLSLKFDNAGQSATLVWQGTQWMTTHAGARVETPTF